MVNGTSPVPAECGTWVYCNLASYSMSLGEQSWGSENALSQEETPPPAYLLPTSSGLRQPGKTASGPGPTRAVAGHPALSSSVCLGSVWGHCGMGSGTRRRPGGCSSCPSEAAMGRGFGQQLLFHAHSRGLALCSHTMWCPVQICCQCEAVRHERCLCFLGPLKLPFPGDSP